METQEEYKIKTKTIKTSEITTEQWEWLLNNANDLNFEIKKNELTIPLWAWEVIKDL